MDPRVVFGETVRRRRESLGLSQERLAEHAGIDRTYVSSVQRGRRNLSLINICRLAGALRCRPADLLAGVEAVAADSSRT